MPEPDHSQGIRTHKAWLWKTLGWVSKKSSGSLLEYWVTRGLLRVRLLGVNLVRDSGVVMSTSGSTVVDTDVGATIY